MNGGYDQFFKEARKAAQGPRPKALKRDKRQTRETPEDRIRQELALRLKAKRKALRAGKAKFPTLAAVTTVLLFTGGIIGYTRADLVEEILQASFLKSFLSHVEVGVFGSAQASEAAAEKKPKESKAAPTEAPVKDAISIQKWTPEELSFFGKLNDRKKELDLREAELAKLDEELHKRKVELDEKLKQLESVRAEISKTLKVRVASDREKIDKLVQVYSTMKPAQASKVIETLDEDLAVELLDNMKKKNAAEILNMMDAKKARRLSELLTGYERSTASVKESPIQKEEAP